MFVRSARLGNWSRHAKTWPIISELELNGQSLSLGLPGWHTPFILRICDRLELQAGASCNSVQYVVRVQGLRTLQISR